MTKRNSRVHTFPTASTFREAHARVHSYLEAELEDIRKSLSRLESAVRDNVVSIADSQSPNSRVA